MWGESSLTCAGSSVGPPSSPASETTALAGTFQTAANKAAKLTLHRWLHVGEVRQTHRVARRESHQLIAQNKSGCEIDFIKEKGKERGLSFLRNHPGTSVPWMSLPLARGGRVMVTAGARAGFCCMSSCVAWDLGSAAVVTPRCSHCVARCK